MHAVATVLFVVARLARTLVMTLVADATDRLMTIVRLSFVAVTLSIGTVGGLLVRTL